MTRRRRVATALLLLLAATAGPARAEDSATITGAEWLRRARAALEPGRSLSARAALEIRDAEGGEVDLELDWIRRTGPDGRAIVVEVRAPDFMAGTVFQIFFRPDGEIDRRAWVPERGRVERVRGDLATDSFLGSSFTYEDLGWAPVAGTVDAAVKRTGGAGDERVQVEIGPYHLYSRSVAVIDAKSGLPLEVTFFDRAGFPFRKLRFDDVREVDGHRLPTTFQVEDVLTGARSRLHFEQIRLDVELDPNLFDEDFGLGTLRRGTRIDVPPTDE